MYCDVVVPDTPLDRLTYRFDEEELGALVPGDCVAVRLRGKKVKAVVVGIRETSPVKRTLPVERLVEKGLVDKELLELSEWVGRYYIASEGEALGHVLPRSIGGYRPRKPVPVPSGPVGDCKDGPAVLEGVEPGRFGVHVSCRASDRLELVAGFLQRCRERGGVVLMLPEQELEEWAGGLRTKLGDGLVEYHAGLGPTEVKRAWQAIRKAERPVVVGVRSAVFAPVRSLGGMAVVDGHEKVFKEERFPRFHARDVAVVRARAAGCPVLLCDRTPSVETWSNLSAGRYTMLEEPEARELRLGARVVDMRKHRAQLFSPMLRRELERAVGEGLALLYVNRHGVSRYVVCRDCGHVIECETCGIAMVLDSSGMLTCGCCGSRRKAPEACPECSGAEFVYRAPGVDMVRREVERILPGVRVFTVTRTSRDEIPEERGAVCVGTRALMSHPWPGGTKLVGAVRLDYELAIPDFRARERTFQTVFEMERRCAVLGARFIVQTWQPDEEALVRGLEQDAAGFLDPELESRQGQRFPPWTRLATVEFRGHSLGLVRTRAERLARELRKVEGVEALGPAPVGVAGSEQVWRLLVRTGRGVRLDRVIDRSGLSSRGVSARVDVDPGEMF